MSETVLGLLALLGALTALSGGYNAAHFARYGATPNGRRLAAYVLCLVNVSFLAQGAWWAIVPVLPESARASWLQGSFPQLVGGVATALASVAITALVLRRKLGNGSGR